MAERTEDVTITLDNGKQIRVKPHHTPEQILKGVKALDPEGSYPSYLKRYGELQANKDGEPSKLGAYADSAIQGVTLGFADEIGAAGDAAWGSITGKGSYSDLYDRNQAVNQANFEQSQEKLGKTERLLLEYGVPIVAARQLLVKLGRKGIDALKTRAGKKALRQEALDAGLTKDEAELWSKINELPNVPKSTLGKYAEKIATGSLGIGATAAAGVGIPAVVGAGQAVPGDRLDSGIAGGILGASAINKLNPLASGFAPKSVVGEILPGFAEGGEVNTNVVDKGTRNRAAIKDFFGKTFDDKQGIHPDVKGTLRSAAELLPIVGDALAAEEIARELQKDPVNWALVGALGGATLIGVVPGLGDAASAAIKAGARKGLDAVQGGAEILSRLEVDTDAVGSLGGNIRLKPKGSGKKKAIETVYIQDPDTGTVREITGTRQQLAKKLGKSESALKKTRGRDTMGAQWSKDPEGFKEFKTGKAKVKEERLDADSIDFTRDQRTALPRSLDPEDRDMLEDLVDRDLQTAMEDHWEFLVDESYLGENDPKISRYFDSVENAEAIAEKAWPSILQRLKNSNWIQGQDNETYNKIVKWAKNRTRQVFDKTQDTDPSGSRSRKLFAEAEEDRREMMNMGLGDPGPVTAIDASSLETVTIPGVERRNVMRDRGQRWSDVERLDMEAKAARYESELDPEAAAKKYGGLPSDYFNQGGLVRGLLKPKSKKKSNKSRRGLLA